MTWLHMVFSVSLFAHVLYVCNMKKVFFWRISLHNYIILQVTSDEITVQVQPLTQQWHWLWDLFSCICSCFIQCCWSDPSTLNSKQRDFRNHLWHCLQNERMDMLSTTIVCTSVTAYPGPIRIVKMKI